MWHVSRRRLARIGLGVVSALVLATEGYSEDGDACAPIEVELKRAGIGAGYSWGRGVVTWKERRYPISLWGIGLAEAGVALGSLTGCVEMSDPNDLAGNYNTVQVGLTIAGGFEGLLLQKPGVVIRLSGLRVGLAATIGWSGWRIELE